MSLLPPNASVLEKNLADAIDYIVNPGVISGFKFKAPDPDNWMKLALSWEYSLSKIRVDNFADRIKQGVEFHRYCGTPYALKMAFAWYNFNNVVIEEEIPGKHFAEFQIGLNEIPNGFEVDTIIDVAKMASPVRSRLSRMYNSLYDVRRFMLDGSKFGDILSDNSGIRLRIDGPKLSFGRANHYNIQAPEISTNHINVRQHYNCAKNIDTYRLDFARLDDAPIDAVNRQSTSFPERFMWNTDHIGKRLENLLQPNTFAKALVILSESDLGSINSCFSGGYKKFTEEQFTLSFSRLSQHRTTTEQTPIEERFIREKLWHAESTFIPTTSGCGRSREYVSVFLYNDWSINKSQIRETFYTANYLGNNTWHEHRHLNVSWKTQKTYTRISRF